MSVVDRFDGLLFVTSRQARVDWGEASFQPILDQLVTLPDGLTDAHDAASPVRAEILERGDIRGVVILGTYRHVPSQAILTVTKKYIDEHPNKRWGEDDDTWWVWSDHLYGDALGNNRPEIPVSRVPIVPANGGLLGLAHQGGNPGNLHFGLRSADFPFANVIHQAIFDDGPMDISPPTHLADPEVLASKMLYLMLHGMPDFRSNYMGKEADRQGQTVTAVDMGIQTATWPKHATVLGGVCWGGLVASLAQQDKGTGVSVVKDATSSLALAMLDRGANAYIGFTGLHYFPADVMSLIFGSPLHYAFWLYHVVEGIPAALALFKARHLAFLFAMSRTTDVVDQAIAIKTYWSATCLGLGW